MSESATGREGLLARVSKRRLVRVALCALALLYASAIYAPLIANDRPYFLEAIDRKAYASALRAIPSITASLGVLIGETPGEYAARRTSGSTSTYAQALDGEAAALRDRLGVIERQLAREDATGLAEFSANVERAVASARADRVSAVNAASELRVRAQRIVSEFAPADVGAAPGSSGKTLVANRSWPLFESLGAGEIFLMVLGPFVLAAALLNRRLATRSSIRPRSSPTRLTDSSVSKLARPLGSKLALPLVLALVCALAWSITVGGHTTFAVSSFKAGLTSGDIVATRVVFPPLAMGFAETNLDEAWRPPTWSAASEMSETGLYVRGPRAPKVDEIPGFQPRSAPVRVKSGERSLNAPLRHPLGTDGSGRDLAARVLWGGRVSLSVGLLSAALLTLIGTTIGAIAGYFGGRIDLLISRVIEIVLCFPAFFLVITVAAITDPDVLPPILAIVLVIALVSWTSVARLARAEFLRLRDQEFVIAARALGFSPARIILRHVLPNALGPILVAGTFAVASGVLVESALSYLGLGIQHPLPSWGALVSESKSAEQWWIQIFPGLLIFVSVIAYNLVGDGLRDALDPRSES